MKDIEKTLKEFHNVKSFAIHSSNSVSITEIPIVALTKDNKLLTYSNGEFAETDGIDTSGNDVTRGSYGAVRPAMWIDLSEYKK